MDPLSITASIMAVFQLTSEVIKYLDDVKDSPKEHARLVTEASNLYGLLMSLKYRLDGGRSGRNRAADEPAAAKKSRRNRFEERKARNRGNRIGWILFGSAIC